MGEYTNTHIGGEAPSAHDRNFQDINDALDNVSARDDAGFVTLKDVALDLTLANDVPHGLGRKVADWRIVRRDANATVWEDKDASGTSQLVLHCSTDVTVDIEVW